MVVNQPGPGVAACDMGEGGQTCGHTVAHHMSPGGHKNTTLIYPLLVEFTLPGCWVCLRALSASRCGPGHE